MQGRVVRISIAPVKALGLVHPDEVELTAAGVPGDRRFWLLDGGGRLANGKRFPQLMGIRPAWDEETRRLVLTLPGGDVVAGVVEPGPPVDVVLYGRPHPSRAVAGPWAEAISAIAGEPLTLLWSEGGSVDRGALGRGWASIVSRGSIDRLGREAGVDHVDGRRFRMLFEIDGVEPHAEDGWLQTRVRVGESTVVPIGDVGRCVTTTFDPETGISDLDTLGVLARYRREGVTEPLPLGVYCEVDVPGRVRVGDVVMPARTSD